MAYGTVLQEQSKLLHERTGQALEALYTATLHEHYSDLAHHYRHSGNTEKAITYLHLAGQHAVQRSANTEAVTYLTTALELLQALPDIPDRAQQELTLQVALGPALMTIKGFAAPEVRTTYARARALCQQVGVTPRLFSVLRGLWEAYQVGGELQSARELANELLTLAQRGQDAALFLQAHDAQGQTLMPLGEFALAREHLEQGLTLYKSEQHHANAFLYGGYDPGVSCWSWRAWGLWPLGYPDQALQSSQTALSLAQDLSHPKSLALALTFAVTLHQLRHEPQVAQERAEALMTLSDEQGSPFLLAWGTLLHGWALAEQGQWQAGIVQLQQGLAAHPATGGETLRPYFLALLAEAYERGEQVEDGLATVAEALDIVNKTGERFYKAEVYRIKGELLLAQSSVQRPASSVKEAEECFLKAVEIAQRQQAKSLELRTVMSLVRLRQQQALEYESRTTQPETRLKLDEAHRLLSEVYNWFTEGFDTKDLQEAKALLEELV